MLWPVWPPVPRRRPGPFRRAEGRRGIGFRPGRAADRGPGVGRVRDRRRAGGEDDIAPLFKSKRFEKDGKFEGGVRYRVTRREIEVDDKKASFPLTWPVAIGRSAVRFT